MTVMDAFCIGRLRFIRLPPSWISLPRTSSTKPQTVDFDLAVGATDDYGTDLQFDSVDLKLEILDATTLDPVRGVQLRLEGASTYRSSAAAHPASVRFAFSPAQGPILKLKLSLTFMPEFVAGKTRSALVFSLSVAPTTSGDIASPNKLVTSTSTSTLRTALGEASQPVIETWDDRRYVLMGLRSGPVEIRVDKEPAKVAQEKVQTAIRTVHVEKPLSSATEWTDAAGAIQITERPGLNNSTGQRLWDCAIGLTSFLSQNPAALDPNSSLRALSHERGDADHEDLATSRPAKRLRPDDASSSSPRQLRVVELGAGCALASMVAAQLLSSESNHGAASVLATDVEATVESTLKENLVANGLALSDSTVSSTVPSRPKAKAPIKVERAVLEWGRLSDEQLAVVLRYPHPTRGRSDRDSPGDDGAALTILATDVLYNPESHPLLLATLLSLLRPTDGPAQSCSPPSGSSPTVPRRALVAYKRRTDGDDGFFPLARGAGLKVQKVWEWGEVGVWSLT
ncbi:hypothetical protein JCM3774_000362 [Rhodotorula dairenensis]